MCLLLFNKDEWIKRRASHVCVFVGRKGGGKIKEGGRKGVYVNPPHSSPLHPCSPRERMNTSNYRFVYCI